MAFGVVIVKIAPEKGGSIVGIIVFIYGGVVMAYGGGRYFEVSRSLERGSFSINTGGVVSILTFGLIFVVALIVVVVMQQL